MGTCKATAENYGRGLPTPDIASRAMTESILVGVDEYPTARDAVALAAALADATRDEIVAAHVYPLDPLADSVAFGAPAADPLHDQAVAIAEHAVAGIAPHARALAVPAHSVAAGLQREAQRAQAELIVVGSSHRGPIGRATLGTHSTRVVHGAPCAVAVAPHGLAGRGVRLRSIAVALDGSDEAADALELARRLAAATTAELRLVTVLAPQIDAWSRYGYVPVDAGYEERARRACEAILAVARPDEEAEVLTGSIAPTLIDLSREVDVLVMGSRSYGPARRLLLGTVSDVLVRSSHCPIVVMPHSARAHAAADAPAGDAAVAV